MRFFFPNKVYGYAYITTYHDFKERYTQNLFIYVIIPKFYFEWFLSLWYKFNLFNVSIDLFIDWLNHLWKSSYCWLDSIVTRRCLEIFQFNEKNSYINILYSGKKKRVATGAEGRAQVLVFGMAKGFMEEVMFKLGLESQERVSHWQKSEFYTKAIKGSSTQKEIHVHSHCWIAWYVPETSSSVLSVTEYRMYVSKRNEPGQVGQGGLNAVARSFDPHL